VPAALPAYHSLASTGKKEVEALNGQQRSPMKDFHPGTQLSNASEETCDAFGTDTRDRHRTCQQRLGSSFDSVMRLVSELTKTHLGGPLPRSAAGAFVTFVE
jgi:hypothetical protein